MAQMKLFVGDSSTIIGEWSTEEYYIEYINTSTGNIVWKKYFSFPGHHIVHNAITVVRKNLNGMYEYIKQQQGESRMLTDKEIIWMLLRVDGDD